MDIRAKENTTIKVNESLLSDKIYKNDFDDNNSRFDRTGNMTTWRVHETYIGSGNHHSLWDDLLKEKRKKKVN